MGLGWPIMCFEKEMGEGLAIMWFGGRIGTGVGNNVVWWAYWDGGWR